MNTFRTINILDMIDAIGEESVNLILSDFSCPKNGEIENFVRKSAVGFAKRKISVTHLVMDVQGRLVAIFSLTHKAVKIQEEVLSSALKKKIKRYAQLDEETGSYMVSAFLIAQFGKNYMEDTEKLLSGNSLMDNAMDILTVRMIITVFGCLENGTRKRNRLSTYNYCDSFDKSRSRLCFEHNLLLAYSR